MDDGGGDCLAHPDAHGAEGSCIEAVLGQEVRHLRAADVHRVRAFVLNDGITGNELANGLVDAVVVERRGIVVHLRLSSGPVLLDPGLESGPPGGLARVLPGLLLEASDELASDGLAIADERDLGRDVGTDLLLRDVELDNADVGIEARGHAEVEDPVQARAHEEDNVGVLEGVRARTSDRKLVVVGDDALAHGGGEEGQLRRFEEFTHFVRGVRVGHALADDDERAVGGA